MPQIPITSTFGYLGVAFLSLAIFLLLTGTGIIKLKGVTVKSGSATIMIGFVFVAIGFLSLFYDNKSNQVANQKIGSTPISSESDNAIALLAKAQNWPIVLYDTFDDNKTKWPEVNTTNSFTTYEQSIASGNYSWHVKANTEGGMVLTSALIQPYESFYFAVDAKGISNIDSLAYGIAVRVQGSNEYYHFRIFPGKQWFAIKYRKKNSNIWEDLAYLPSSKIQSTGTNRIGVVAIGPDYWFYINDSFVYHFNDARLTTGLVGLITAIEHTGQEADVEFDNFEYRSAP